jgi:hypothetical protein
VGKTRGDPNLSVTFGGEIDADPLTKSRGVAPKIDRNIKDRS